MYTVEKIEDNIITLEDRKTKSIFYINKKELPNDIREGDILNKIDNNYIKDEKETKIVKNNINNKFQSLIK